MSFIRFIFMGSGSESSNKKGLPKMEQELEVPCTVGTKKQDRKPPRSILYSESFYCPLVGENNDVVKYASLREATLPLQLNPDPENILMELDQNLFIEEKASEAKIEEHFSEIGPSVDPDIDDKVEEAIIAVNNQANSKSTLGFYQPERVDIPSECVQVKDSAINTSQPTYADVAVGNSQPLLVDCSTGMSQPLLKIESVDCGTQTSQEFFLYPNPVNKTIGNKNEGQLESKGEKPLRQYLATMTNKAPIVFPRVSGQVVGPDIPVKIPRLDELDSYDKPSVVNPISIYSSCVTFDFDETDKENDICALRQRDEIGQRMRDVSSSCEESGAGIAQHNKSTFLPAAPSSKAFNLVSSRGPFLRVGLSKKSRTRKPLHPRIYESEDGGDENFEN